jgi:hypothetical protein
MTRPIAAAPPAIAASFPRPDFGAVVGAAAATGAAGVSGIGVSEVLLMDNSIGLKGERKV